MNRKAFFDALRPYVNLTRENVAGAERILTYGEKQGTPRNDFAYALATAWWETGQRMQPITEYGSRRYLRSKKYWPFVGRGLIQVTWDYNYRKAAKSLELPLSTFMNEPNLLLEWKYALPLLFVGLETGMYTGKALDDYIDDIDEPDDEDLREYVAARRIVNGTDKARTIGQLALHFEHALIAAGYTVDGGRGPLTQPVPPPPAPPVTREPDRPPAGFPAVILAAFGRLFRLWSQT
ncbi:MAG: glycoside hydrolase family 19 protein [Alphaproteobacteria bacterium]